MSNQVLKGITNIHSVNITWFKWKQINVQAFFSKLDTSMLLKMQNILWIRVLLNKSMKCLWRYFATAIKKMFALMKWMHQEFK